MTALQIALLSGVLMASGLVLLVNLLAPSTPSLADALANLTQPVATGQQAAQELTWRQRLGLTAMRHTPPSWWAGVRDVDLDLLGTSRAEHYGRKVFGGLFGLLIPGVVQALWTLMGLHMPFMVPVGAGVILAVVLFIDPDRSVRKKAEHARAGFTRGVAIWIELVAMERNAGSGTREAMERAALLGDSWVFRRLNQDLRRCRWSGVPPWEAVRQLGKDIAMPELEDLADILRLSGEESARVYESLRARGRALRDEIRATDRASVNQVTEKMTMPMALMGMVLIGMLMTPAVLRLAEGG